MGINANDFRHVHDLQVRKKQAMNDILHGRLPRPLVPCLVEKAMTKREGGKDYPASAYAYVPDAEKPSTWKLRLIEEPGGSPTSRQVGRAVAALGKGFRGQKVQIPAGDLPGVKRKVLAAWLKANPDKKRADAPAALK